jgi:hypothetical protein
MQMLNKNIDITIYISTVEPSTDDVHHEDHYNRIELLR